MRLIPSFDAYAIDKSGQVFRVRTRDGDPCQPRPSKSYRRKNGYLSVALRKDGITHTVLIHRLVALTYLKDPQGFDVCHWNHKRDDNRVENLYIGTRAENTQQSGREGRYGYWRKGVPPTTKKLTPDLISKIKTMYATGQYRQVDIAAEFKISQKTVSAACRA